ncbi:hypothetical protein KVR01_008553 [Diaporthe batatas]|uniref:uncharacterized protein n=1 Tax=Diaporthe batatas TaxID=748121 RepID=UPI001D04F559|nr:uncharacterized protein KVR01_008553 [Diaporthe batatas]KAG8161566.1 hypothetical protein KVR01_008553 [Diaporthe batatas]
MDPIELSPNPPETPDAAGGNLLEATRARDMLFDDILQQLALCNLFSDPVRAPTIFPVYAHDNESAGVAHAGIVHRIIEWLQKIKARIISDKAALHPLVSNKENASAHRNILSNQIRLLPIGNSADSKANNNAIDKVIVCASDVLKRYCEDDVALDYITRIRDLCNVNHGKSMEYIETVIRGEVDSEIETPDFHHVLTELALLEVRKSRLSGDHGMVPVALNGDHRLPYLSFFGSTDLTLKLESSTSTPGAAALHKLFFKMLEQLFVEHKDLVKECKKCYDKVAQELNLENGEPLSKETFRNCLGQNITNMYHSYWNVFSTVVHNGKYVTYAGKIGEHTFQILEATKADERQKILQWVSGTHISDSHGVYGDGNKKRVNGTCDWVIHDQRFRDWHTSDKSEILLLSGSMGTGKTYATSRVIDWIGKSLEGSDYDESFAYLYCMKQDNERNNPKAILRSIVKQIASGPWNRRGENVALDEAVTDIWKKHSNDQLQFCNTFSEWRDCLFKLVKKYPRTTIVLDALDECVECDEDKRGSLVDLLTTLSSGDMGFVKIFCSTRPELDLSQLLNKYPVISTNGDQNQKDMGMFVRNKLEQNLSWLKHDYKEKISRALVERSRDMFLFASLQIDRLLECEFEEDVEDRLRDLPRSLNEAYKDIYIKVTTDREGRRMSGTKKFLDRALRWVLCSARPLTTDELLLAISQDPESDIVKPQHSRLTEDWISARCRNLLTLDPRGYSDDGEVSIYHRGDDPRPVWRLAHQAVADFIENSAESVSKDSKLFGDDTDFSPEFSHYEAGKICLMVLVDLFGRSPSSAANGSYGGPRRSEDLEDLFEDYRDENWVHVRLKRPLVEYAIMAWPTHVRAHERCESPRADGLSRPLKRFLCGNEDIGLAYERWLAHTFFNSVLYTDDWVPVPTWSVFATRSLPTLWLGRHTCMRPINLACHLGFKTVLREWLQSSGSEQNSCYESANWLPIVGQSTPIRWSLKWSIESLACTHGEADILDLVLGRGSQINTADDDAVPPIVAAAIADSEPAAKMLLNRSIDLDSAFTRKHGHVLMFAIWYDSLNMMRLLLHDILTEAREVEEILASAHHRSFKSPDAIEMLLEHGVDVNTSLKDSTLLMEAAYNGWEELSRRLLEDGADVNKQFPGPGACNALQSCVSPHEAKTLSIPCLLIEHKARVDGRVVSSALSYNWLRGISSRQGLPQLLLDNKPHLNDTWLEHAGGTCDDNAMSALIEQVKCGHVKNVRLLIKHGADVKLRVKGKYDDALNTAFLALMECKEYPFDRMIEALLEGGASFKGRYGDRLNTPLAGAAHSGFEEMVQNFLDRGADPNAICKHKYITALAAAVASEHPRALHIVRMLLEHGANVNVYFPEPVKNFNAGYSSRLALDLPLCAIISPLGQRGYPSARRIQRMKTALELASYFVSKGAIWDIDFEQWRTCCEMRVPDFYRDNAESFNQIMKGLRKNRVIFFQDNPGAASDERWTIKAADDENKNDRKLFNRMHAILN